MDSALWNQNVIDSGAEGRKKESISIFLVGKPESESILVSWNQAQV